MVKWTRSMVRALAGAPITVLVLLMVERAACNQAFIRRHTGFTSDQTIHDAIELLADYGLITNVGRYTWQIASGVEQLPLGLDALPEESQHDQAIEGQVVESSDKNRSQILRPDPLASSSLTTLDSLEENQPLDSRSSSQNLRAENLAALDAAGIREPARSRLVNLAHVTPELIRAHCAECKNPGQAIYRIEHNFSPRSKEEPERVYEVPDPPAPEPETVDQQAQSWWVDITDRLRDQVPRHIYSSFVLPAYPARRVGDVLAVRVNTSSTVEILAKHIRSPDLVDLACAVSGGEVHQVRFVTSWEDDP